MLYLGSVYNQFKFCFIACTLGQDKTNAPGTAKVQGSNLTGPVFSKGSTPFEKIIVGVLLSAYVLPD